MAKNPHLLETLRARVAAFDVDTCASVRLSRAGDDVLINVSLSDGRSATRRVSSGVDVVDIVETLLTLPTPAPSSPVTGREPPAPSPAPPTERAASPPAPLTSPASPPPMVPAETRVPATAFELGIAMAGRLSGRPTLFGLSGSALAEVVLDDWLVGARAHAEPARETPARVQLKSFGIGLAGGHRFHSRGFDVDATLGADALFQQQAAAGGIPQTSLLQPRFVAATHLSEAGPSAFYLYLGADVEAWPGRVPKPTPQLSVWPWWAVSLSFGVKVSPL